MPQFDFVLSGRYRLLGPLGEGGMASVYRARDLRLNREVAVKILRDELTRDPDFLSRFEREAQIVARLSHPNIVPVYDVGVDGGSHYIVMEFVRGRTLKEILEGGPIPQERVTGLLTPALQALQYAHEHGLVHRDVKPQNILVTPDGVPHLADFGIAHLTDSSSTRTATILGSAHYLSPEQARGDEAAAASDVYACGVVLYEMLTGRPPFEGSNALQVAHHQVHSAPKPLPSSIDPRLQSITLRALAKEPSERFASAAEFARALSQTGLTEQTARLPIPSPTEQTESMPRQARVAEREPKEATDLVLKRSGRRTLGLAVILGGSLAILAYVASVQPAGITLPAYPSAPYVLILAALAAVLAVSWLSNRSWSYRMDDDAAVVHWGLLSHNRFGIPLRQVSSVELKQSAIDRLLGVGTVELYARDHLGDERRLVMEDLAHPRQTYEQLMRLLGRAGRPPVATEGE